MSANPIDGRDGGHLSRSRSSNHSSGLPSKLKRGASASMHQLNHYLPQEETLHPSLTQDSNSLKSFNSGTNLHHPQPTPFTKAGTNAAARPGEADREHESSRLSVSPAQSAASDVLSPFGTSFMFHIDSPMASPTLSDSSRQDAPQPVDHGRTNSTTASAVLGFQSNTDTDSPLPTFLLLDGQATSPGDVAQGEAPGAGYKRPVAHRPKLPPQTAVLETTPTGGDGVIQAGSAPSTPALSWTPSTGLSVRIESDDEEHDSSDIEAVCTFSLSSQKTDPPPAPETSLRPESRAGVGPRNPSCPSTPTKGGDPVRTTAPGTPQTPEMFRSHKYQLNPPTTAGHGLTATPRLKIGHFISITSPRAFDMLSAKTPERSTSVATSAANTPRTATALLSPRGATAPSSSSTRVIPNTPMSPGNRLFSPRNQHVPATPQDQRHASLENLTRSTVSEPEVPPTPTHPQLTMSSPFLIRDVTPSSQGVGTPAQPSSISSPTDAVAAQNCGDTTPGWCASTSSSTASSLLNISRGSLHKTQANNRLSIMDIDSSHEFPSTSDSHSGNGLYPLLRGNQVMRVDVPSSPAPHSRGTRPLSAPRPQSSNDYNNTAADTHIVPSTPSQRSVFSPRPNQQLQHFPSHILPSPRYTSSLIASSFERHLVTATTPNTTTTTDRQASSFTRVEVEGERVVTPSLSSFRSSRLVISSSTTATTTQNRRKQQDISHGAATPRAATPLSLHISTYQNATTSRTVAIRPLESNVAEMAKGSPDSQQTEPLTPKRLDFSQSESARDRHWNTGAEPGVVLDDSRDTSAQPITITPSLSQIHVELPVNPSVSGSIRHTVATPTPQAMSHDSTTQRMAQSALSQSGGSLRDELASDPRDRLRSTSNTPIRRASSVRKAARGSGWIEAEYSQRLRRSTPQHPRRYDDAIVIGGSTATLTPQSAQTVRSRTASDRYPPQATPCGGIHSASRLEDYSTPTKTSSQKQPTPSSNRLYSQRRRREIPDGMCEPAHGGSYGASEHSYHVGRASPYPTSTSSSRTQPRDLDRKVFVQPVSYEEMLLERARRMPSEEHTTMAVSDQNKHDSIAAMGALYELTQNPRLLSDLQLATPMKKTRAAHTQQAGGIQVRPLVLTSPSPTRPSTTSITSMSTTAVAETQLASDMSFMHTTSLQASSTGTQRGDNSRLASSYNDRAQDHQNLFETSVIAPEEAPHSQLHSSSNVGVFPASMPTEHSPPHQNPSHNHNPTRSPLSPGATAGTNTKLNSFSYAIQASALFLNEQLETLKSISSFRYEQRLAHLVEPSGDDAVETTAEANSPQHSSIADPMTIPAFNQQHHGTVSTKRSAVSQVFKPSLAKRILYPTTASGKGHPLAENIPGNNTYSHIDPLDCVPLYTFYTAAMAGNPLPSSTSMAGASSTGLSSTTDIQRRPLVAGSVVPLATSVPGFHSTLTTNADALAHQLSGISRTNPFRIRGKAVEKDRLNIQKTLFGDTPSLNQGYYQSGKQRQLATAEEGQQVSANSSLPYDDYDQGGTPENLHHHHHQEGIEEGIAVAGVDIDFELNRRTGLDHDDDSFLDENHGDETAAQELPAVSLSTLHHRPAAAANQASQSSLGRHLRNYFHRPLLPLSKRPGFNDTPVNVLEAPDLIPDYYFNVIHWGPRYIALSLGTTVYLFETSTEHVHVLYEFPREQNSNLDHYGTSVKISPSGDRVAVGSSFGMVLVFSIATFELLFSYHRHTSRVNVLDWYDENHLTSGSHDNRVLHTDLRQHQHIGSIDIGSELFGEVCGLAWNVSTGQLAVGTNSNICQVYDLRVLSTPRVELLEHCAAVKALAWSPHDDYVLATGAGSSDRHLRLYDTNEGVLLNSKNTGSQISGIIWSRFSHELITCHGFYDYQIAFWSADSLTSLGQLTGHSRRILCSSLDPQGTHVVTIGADETIRIWDVWTAERDAFYASKSSSKGASVSTSAITTSDAKDTGSATTSARQRESPIRPSRTRRRCLQGPAIPQGGSAPMAALDQGRDIEGEDQLNISRNINHEYYPLGEIDDGAVALRGIFSGAHHDASIDSADSSVLSLASPQPQQRSKQHQAKHSPMASFLTTFMESIDNIDLEDGFTADSSSPWSRPSSHSPTIGAQDVFNGDTADTSPDSYSSATAMGSPPQTAPTPQLSRSRRFR